MKNQNGSLLIVLMISLAIMAILTALYFTRSSDGQKSQYEKGQEGLQQAEQIYQQGVEESNRIKVELEQ